METAKSFFATFVSDLLGLTTGVASMILAILASWTGPNDSMIWWSAAYLCGMFSAYRLWKAEFQKPGPQIIVEYQTLNQTTVNESHFTDWERWKTGGGEQEIPFILRNESPIAAYNVQVRSISLAGNTASFEPIPMVVKGEPKQVTVTIGEFGVLQMHNFREFLSLGWQSLDTLVVPIVVAYTDIHGRLFESEFEIKCNRWVSTTVLKIWRPVERWPKWLTKLNK